MAHESLCLRDGLAYTHQCGAVRNLRAVIVVSFVVIAFVAGCDDGNGTRPQPPSPDAVVAKVDGQPIRVEEVSKYLSPPDPAIAIGSPINPRRQALDTAIRLRLFAKEARSRGFHAPDGPSDIIEANLVQSLIRAELDQQSASRHLGNAETHRYYEKHRELFNGDGLQSITLSNIVVKKPLLAERLLARANATDDESFARLVEEYSIEEATNSEDRFFAVLERGTKGPVAEGDKKLDNEVAGVGWSLRKPGQVGMARDSKGRYRILRADKVKISFKLLGSQLLPYVESIAIEERREHTLKKLEQRLMDDARIVVHESTLYAMPVPRW